MTRIHWTASALLALACLVTAACSESTTAAPSEAPSGASSATAPAASAAATSTSAQNQANAATDTGGAQPAAVPVQTGIQPLPFGQVVDVVQKARGEVVFFHLYASWCGPCRHEFPDVVELGKRYRAQGLRMVTVSVDEQRADLEAFLRPHNANIVFPSYLMTGSEQEFTQGLGTLGANFQGGIPYTAVYDRNGKLAMEWTGSRDLAFFERVIQPLL